MMSVLANVGVQAAHKPTPQDLSRMSLEELADVKVTSVSKKAEPIGQAPAAIYVITSEDIRRSGAVSLPEILRLAPNLQVVRSNALTYAISARGFNTVEAANKLLVMIDGRSIYTVLHGGVFWDQQQVLPEDIDRIEVVSGPGGTLWGANAVNGVINIITKDSRETVGGLVTGHYGDVDKGMAARYATELGSDAAIRVYGMGFKRGNTLTPQGRSAGDDFSGRQGGIRTDWSADGNTITLQGDVFESAPQLDGQITGHNILLRFDKDLGDGSALEVQAYYDNVERSAGVTLDAINAYDVQAQHTVPLGTRQQIIWGGGHRIVEDEFKVPGSFFFLQPASDTLSISNLFVQDAIALHEDVTLTLGTKLEHSSLAGTEFLPNARVAWRVTEGETLWAAVSRAVRTPSRIDRDLLGPGVTLQAEDFSSEELIAYEVGYRGEPWERSTLSVSLFYNKYDDLRILTVVPPGPLPLRFGNAMEGFTFGLEAWGDHRISDRWRISAGVNVLEKRLTLEPGAVQTAFEQHFGNDPEYQFQIHSFLNLTDDVELDLGLRAVDDLSRPEVPGYIAFDARIGWHVTPDLDLSIAGFNLFDDQHPENGAPATRREIPRSVFLNARWRF